MAADWQIYLRDSKLKHQALFDDYAKFEMVVRDRGGSNWALDLPLNEATRLIQPGSGIIAHRNGAPFLSGPINKIQRANSNNRDTIMVAGVDDTSLLNDRVAMPQPLTVGPPYNVASHDVRSGLVSSVIRDYVNVNAGPGALPSRQIFGLYLGEDPAVGPNVIGRARYQKLSALLDDLALQGEVLYRIVQVGLALEFQVFKPRDRTGEVHFSRELGNLADFSYTLDAPGSNYVVVGAGGQGTARIIQELSDTPSAELWARRIEMFRDRRDTQDPVEITGSASEQLKETAARATLELQPVDTEQMRFRQHYDLGDRVTVVIDGEEIQEAIREVKITLDADGETVEPSIGTPGGDVGPNATVARLFGRISQLEDRIADLERRQ